MSTIYIMPNEEEIKCPKNDCRLDGDGVFVFYPDAISCKIEDNTVINNALFDESKYLKKYKYKKINELKEKYKIDFYIDDSQFDGKQKLKDVLKVKIKTNLKDALVEIDEIEIENGTE